MSNCLICGKENPIQKPPQLARWGERKYCSTLCIKTAYRYRYPEKDKLQKRIWLENNKEKRKIVSSSYMKRNRDYYNSYSSLRKRHMRDAQPKWQDANELLDVYKEAQYMQLEVDHIIPIKHKLVCGLHVVSNLQLLSRSDNAKKNNKFEPRDEDILVIIKE